MRFMFRVLALVALLASVASFHASAQGRAGYYNTESVQVDPITIVEVGGRQFIAAVNTPDNSVEFYDTAESQAPDQRFLQRLGVGIEPVSLRWVPELGRLYVANSLSDGISIVDLVPDPVQGLVATVERTAWVADEPVSIAYLPFEEDDGQGGTLLRDTLVIAHRDQDHFSWVDAHTLAPVAPGTRVINATVPKGDIDQDGQPDDIAIKAPRDVEVHCNRLFVLGEKGGGRPEYDFDVYWVPDSGGPTRDLAIPNTSNFNFAFASNDDLFIVGSHALNDTVRGEANLRALPTGFAVSTLTMVRGICSDDPEFKMRDVNLEAVDILEQNPQLPVPLVAPLSTRPAAAIQGPAPQTALRPVAKNRAMTLLTSVVVYEPPGARRKVFFTAMGNDKLGIAEPRWNQSADQWNIRRLGILRAPGSSNPMAGPRGLALKAANPSDPSDPGDRLYVLNRLDNAITIVDPATEQRLGVVALQHDPTPLYIRTGRQLLYDARLGNGFNSCATCHTDARTDGLAWDLSDGVAVAFPPLIKDNQLIAATAWPANKNFMITQSLQGLLNWEVDPEIQDLVTNKPYHWRADREDFLAFSPAFDKLLGGVEPDPEEMIAFETFVNSIHYPPNPKQPFNRTYSGVPFDGDQPSELPTEAQAGLFIYHLFGSVGTFTCAHCHALPEGSENKIPLVLAFDNPFDPTDPQGNQPVEAAALRGLTQKSARIERNGTTLPEDAPIVGLEGMLHTGFQLKDPTDPAFTNLDFNNAASINAFIRAAFAGSLGCGTGVACVTVTSVNQMMHEFDTGSAPAVGFPFTVDSTISSNTGLTATILDLQEGEALVANAGLAVRAKIGAADRGFVYDPRLDLYSEEPSGASLNRGQLLGLVSSPSDRLHLLGTPLGSERRVAIPTGQVPPAQPGGVPPTQVKLLPMAPNTAYFNVPTLTFNFFDPTSPPQPSHGGFFTHTIRLYQVGVLASAPAGEDFGVGKRWEPSRRFRVAVSGVGFNPELELFVHDDPNFPTTPPNLGLTPEDPGQIATRKISLPLHPTGEVDPATDAPVYETSAELDAREFLQLMLGGAHHPAVVATLNDEFFTLSEEPLDPSLNFDADGFNWLYVRVVAETGLPGDGGWQRLRLQ